VGRSFDAVLPSLFRSSLFFAHATGPAHRPIAAIIHSAAPSISRAGSEHVCNSNCVNSRDSRCTLYPDWGKSRRANSCAPTKANTFSSMEGRSGSIASHTSEFRPFLSLEVADRQREPLRRQRLGKASGLHDVAIVEHRVDRVRGVFRAKERVAPVPLSEP
jgi:hypothetical protein